MEVDPLDQNVTSDRIALGYTTPNGGCVREMVASGYVGSVVGSDENNFNFDIQLSVHFFDL